MILIKIKLHCGNLLIQKNKLLYQENMKNYTLHYLTLNKKLSDLFFAKQIGSLHFASTNVFFSTLFSRFATLENLICYITV